MRTLFYILIIYIGYRLFKRWLKGILLSQSGGDSSGEIAEEVLMKDPVCGIYHPKHSSYHVHLNGTDWYLCSEECKSKFIEQNKVH